MNCEICFEPYDHSIHKPYHLSCPHTYCLSCLNQLFTNKCPTCNKSFFEKNINMALLNIVPESNYDNMKSEVLKEYINLNEVKQDLKSIQKDKLNTHETKLASIKQTITDETNKTISFLRKNEEILKEECDDMLNWIKSYLYSDNNLKLFQIDDEKEKIEKDRLSGVELDEMNILIFDLKQKLNKRVDQIKNYENKYEFVKNNNLFSIGEMRTSYGYNKKGQDFHKLEKYEEAIKCYDISIKLDPNDSSIFYNNKGIALFCLNKCEEAIEYFSKSIELEPSDSVAYYNKGNVLLGLKRFDEAIISYDEKIKLDPTHSGVYYNKGKALESLKKYQEANICYDKAKELNKE